MAAACPNSWCGIQTTQRRESVVAALLQYKGYDVYLPVYEKQKRWSDRTVNISSPLFPGYLFCRFDISLPPVVTTPGVVSLLGSPGRPEQIPEEEISAIQAMLRSGLPLSAHRYLREGEGIAITNGPLKGVTGMLVRSRDKMKVVVSIRLLQRSVAVVLDRNDVEQDRIAHACVQ